MDEMNLEYNFGPGYVQSNSICRVISQYDGLVEYGSKTSSLMMWSKRKNGWFHYNLGWTAVRIACDDSTMYALGEDGHFLVADAAGVREEKAPGASEARPFRDLCLIGDTLYALGGSSGVLRRTKDNDWEAFGSGFPADMNAQLFSIHGISDEEIYVVGKDGLILRFSNGKWAAVKSPTENDIFTVRVTETGVVYAACAGGQLLRGRKETFELLAATTPSGEDLFGVAWFRGNLYVADEKNLYALEDDERLAKITVPNGPAWTFKHLHSNGDVLWSFGRKHIFWTEDVTTWHNVTPSFTLFDPSESGPMASKSSCGCGSGGH